MNSKDESSSIPSPDTDSIKMELTNGVILYNVDEKHREYFDSIARLEIPKGRRKTKQLFDDETGVKRFLEQQPISKFLKLKPGTLNCIFHDDKKPSAKIDDYTGGEGKSTYLCFVDSPEHALDIFNVTSYILFGKFTGHYDDVLSYLISFFNVKKKDVKEKKKKGLDVAI